MSKEEMLNLGLTSERSEIRTIAQTIITATEKGYKSKAKKGFIKLKKMLNKPDAFWIEKDRRRLQKFSLPGFASALKRHYTSAMIQDLIPQGGLFE